MIYDHDSYSELSYTLNYSAPACRQHNAALSRSHASVCPQRLELQSEEWQALYDEVTANLASQLAALKAERQRDARELRAVRKEVREKRPFRPPPRRVLAKQRFRGQ